MPIAIANRPGTPLGVMDEGSRVSFIRPAATAEATYDYTGARNPNRSSLGSTSCTKYGISFR